MSNTVKIFEMEMKENTSVCFIARMPEVFSFRATEWRVTKRQEKPVRRFVLSFFAFDLSSPKDSKKGSGI